jgi:hypothetical protein
MKKIYLAFKWQPAGLGIIRCRINKAFITFFLFISLFLKVNNAHAQVGLGTTNPHPTAVLDLSSNNKGILVPRMTLSEKNAIPNPAQGLLVFQTDQTTGFYYYNNQWIYINSAGLQGTPGVNGRNTLVKTTTEAAGANCIKAGVKLEFGLDANNNNVLDVAEINASLTKYVCNGSTPGSFDHYIGEAFGGGVIFHLWKDAAAVEHGLIVAQTGLVGNGSAWSNVSSTEIGATARSTWNGLSNCGAIVNQPGHAQSAAGLSLLYVSNGFGDWYLPSYAEMNLLWTNLFNVNKTLSTISGASPIPLFNYWTSTESNNSQAFGFFMFTGTPQEFSKSIQLSIIAIRSF